MSQLGLRGKSFLNGCERGVGSVSARRGDGRYRNGAAHATYTKPGDKDNELLLGLVCGPHAVIGLDTIPSAGKTGKANAMIGRGGVYSRCCRTQTLPGWHEVSTLSKCSGGSYHTVVVKRCRRGSYQEEEEKQAR